MNEFSNLNQHIGSLVEPVAIPASPETQVLTTSSSLTGSRFWREFAAGMQMLMQYRGHIKGDLRPILRHNLQLLYQTFKHETVFQQQLDWLELQAPGIWRPLADTTDMHCGIIRVGRQNVNLNTILRQISMCETSRNISYKQNRTHAQGLLITLVLKGRLNSGEARPVKAGQLYVHAIDSEIIPVNSVTSSCQLLLLAMT